MGWAVVIPVLLRHWLRGGHISPAFLSAIQDYAIRTQDPFTPANVIIRAFAAAPQPLGRELWSLRREAAWVSV
jgi:hypothetical protein